MCSTTLLALLALTLPSPPSDSSEVDGFRYVEGRLQAGRLYRYRKSNVDGSRASLIDLYLATTKRIESFKSQAGYPEATLVTAEMDWKTFSVGRFETFKRYADGRSVSLAELQAEGDTLIGKLKGGSFRVDVEFFPWHTYDFDLASLNVSLRYLTDPEGVVDLGMIDVVRGALQFKGMVELRFEADEERCDIPCRRYSLDGPGLNDRGGTLWVRKGDDPVIVEYEIDLPDEPGMTSGKLTLLGTDELTAEEWEEHMEDRLR